MLSRIYIKTPRQTLKMGSLTRQMGSGSQITLPTPKTVKNALFEGVRKMAETQTIMTTKELADYFKVSPALIREQAKKGELPFFKIGNEIRFHKDKVLEAVFKK